METRFGLEASCRGHGFWEYARTMIEPQFVVFINRGLAGPWESFFFLCQYVTFPTAFFIVTVSNKEKYIQ